MVEILKVWISQGTEYKIILIKVKYRKYLISKSLPFFWNPLFCYITEEISDQNGHTSLHSSSIDCGFGYSIRFFQHLAGISIFWKLSSVEVVFLRSTFHVSVFWRAGTGLIKQFKMWEKSFPHPLFRNSLEI